MLFPWRWEMKFMHLKSIRQKPRSQSRACGTEGASQIVQCADSSFNTQFVSYVVCTTRRPPVSWATDLSSSSAIKAPAKTEEPQQVFIGIFPASHIFVR